MRFFRGCVVYLVKHLEFQSLRSLSQGHANQIIQHNRCHCEQVRKASGKPLREKVTTQCSSDLSSNKDKLVSNSQYNSKTHDSIVARKEEDDPGLSALVNENVCKSNPSCSKDIVLGKGMPPEPPVDCCMSGCANCVWIMYANELRNYYKKDGNERAKKEIEKIENPSLKMFLKLELGLL
ncbi:uncharacterized protein LOC133189593 [Saccostrea echinata]|uniref:uncharacterized protein LOC133189593 n=1 Tax=Saccostrea echinata TaxID=191078 RepID=UPI002A7ECF83|nr:uncharacterized protein LOC133189593 [Saccostrea echinata]XP_061180962.1 uncharacterized protein LOC133189593 [Saccostrea echinata]